MRIVFNDVPDVTVSVSIPHWHAGTIATLAAILNQDGTVEMSEFERRALEALLGMCRDVCHDDYRGDMARLLMEAAAAYKPE